MAEQVKLFVGGVSGAITEGLLRDYFSKYGTVVETYIRRDSGRTPRGGFGFVTFADAASLSRALQDQQQHFIQGQRVSLMFLFFNFLFLFLKNFWFQEYRCFSLVGFLVSAGKV